MFLYKYVLWLWYNNRKWPGCQNDDDVLFYLIYTYYGVAAAFLKTGINFFLGGGHNCNLAPFRDRWFFKLTLGNQTFPSSPDRVYDLQPAEMETLTIIKACVKRTHTE